MRYLALDVGTKTVGVAISDKTNTLASPMPTINFSNVQEAVIQVKDIIVNHDIIEVVIGKPLNMDGSSGFACERSEYFKEQLLLYIDIPITFIDERLTTKEAENILIAHDYKRKNRKKVIDSVAAVLILDTFLKMKG